MASFTGRLTLTVDLDLEDADADLLASNLKDMLEERLSYVDVRNYSINTERYSS